MPRLKQPAALQAIAMDALVAYALQLRKQLSDLGSLEKFRQGISVMKEKLRDQIPRHFLEEFTRRFVTDYEEERENFTPREYRLEQKRAAVEMMMDIEIVGLRCDKWILDYGLCNDFHRLRGITELRSCGQIEVGNFHLKDLTTLMYPDHCSDHDLTIIGQNCPKLRSVRIQLLKITDSGLRALSLCSELRAVDILYCRGVSHIGVNHLMSVHEKLEDLSVSAEASLFISRLDKPCSSLKRFCIATAVVQNAYLRTIVEMFPNLTNFEMICRQVGDLSILKSLSNLDGIMLAFFDGWLYLHEIDRAWWSFKKLLSFIGGNIKTLRFFSFAPEGHGLSDPNSLDFIFHSCPNIEYLQFDHGHHDLIVPPFRKVKCLSLYERGVPLFPWATGTLFGEMLNLEDLEPHNLLSFETVKSMILDDTKFPKLARVHTPLRLMTGNEFATIKRIPKDNNLEFEMCDPPAMPFSQLNSYFPVQLLDGGMNYFDSMDTSNTVR